MPPYARSGAFKFKISSEVRQDDNTSVRGDYRANRRGAKINEIEELKRLLQTGFGKMDREFEGIRKEFVKVHEQFDKLEEKLAKSNGEILERLKRINANLEGNQKS